MSIICASNTISHVYKQIFAGIASNSIQFCCNSVLGFFYSSFFLLLAQNSSIFLTKSTSHLLCIVLQLLISFFVTKQKKASFFFFQFSQNFGQALILVNCSKNILCVFFVNKKFLTKKISL